MKNPLDASVPGATPAPTAQQLKPWTAGRSGNPAGRPPLGQALAELVRDHTSDGLDVVILLRDAVRDGVVRTIDPGSRKVSTTPVTFRDRLAAAELLLARGWGGPVQQLRSETVQLTIDGDLAGLTTAELRDRVEALRELAGIEHQGVDVEHQDVELEPGDSELTTTPGQA